MTDIDVSVEKRCLDPKWRILIAVMVGNFIVPLDASIVNTLLPSFTKFFHTELSLVQWVPTVYLLTISCFILLYGRLGDMLGHKKIFITGLAGFTTASLLCGFSQSIWMLIAFRTVQGLAGGMVTAVGTAIVTAAFPPNQRGKALGIHLMCIAIGLTVGPTLGGIITHYINWRWVFFINIPIGVFALIWGIHAIPLGHIKSGQRLDMSGTLIAIVFLFSLLLYANRGEDWGWLSPLPIGLLVVAILSGAAFIWVERRSPQPMLNLALFSNRVFRFCNLSALFCFIAAYSVVFLTPFYITFVLHYSILKVGMIMVAYPLGTLCVSPLSGAASDRIGTRILTCCGMGICVLCLLFFSGLKTSSESFDVIWRLALIGIGLGIFQSPNSSALMGSVPKIHLGIASGIMAAVRNVGMVLGIAIAGAVLYNVAPIAVSKHPGAFNSSEMQLFLAGFRWAYISGAIMAGIAVLTSFAAVERRRQD